MAEQNLNRRLVAILAADVVGYSRLMGADEAATLATLRAHREALIDPEIAEHHGRIFKTTGDGLLVEFPSVVKAVQCAVAIQRAMAERNSDTPEDRKMQFRIGINVGDVIIEGDDIFGDGVNVAARLEGLAEPGGICVRRAVRNQVRDKLPLAFEDLGEIEVKNIARPIRAFRVVLEGAAGRPAPRAARRRRRGGLILAAAMGVLIAGAGAALWLKPWAPGLESRFGASTALPLPDKPSIAVLPFTNISNDPEQDYFADGMTDDLITDLSKVSGLFVIARNSVFTYKGRAVNVQDVGRELGVRYVLEGSVRRSGNRVRINAQLIDAATGHHLWAERYDRSRTDLFAMQDDVIERIVSALAVQLTDTEQAQLARIPTANLEAYDQYLRAEQEGFHTADSDKFRRTLSYYQKAIELDPAFADAHAGYARAVVEIWRLSYSDLLAGAVARQRAYEAAGSALNLDPVNARAYSVLALLQLLDGRHEEAIDSARKAVEFHPSNAEAYVNLGFVLAYSGLHAEAVSMIETALRLDPSPPPDFQLLAGITFYIARRNDRAVEALRAARDAFPKSESLREHLAAAYARQGQLDLAKTERDALLEIFPVANQALFRLTYQYMRNDADRDYHIAGLEAAGLPRWPFGFEGRDEDRVEGDALEALVWGRTWVGEHRSGIDFVQQVDDAGLAAYRSAKSFLTGQARVERNRVCLRFSGYYLDREVCGYVYRNRTTEGSGRDYVHVGPDSLKYFSLAE